MIIQLLFYFEISKKCKICQFLPSQKKTCQANKKSNKLFASLNRPFRKGPPQNQDKLRGGITPRTRKKEIFNREPRTTTATKEIIRTKVNMSQEN